MKDYTIQEELGFIKDDLRDILNKINDLEYKLNQELRGEDDNKD